jgi:uncharacterized protein YdiU (UPF0061 family)
MTIAFDNSYARLPERFFTFRAPMPVKAPRLLKLNDGLAAELGLDAEWLRSTDGVAMLAGNAFPECSAALAQAYAGHQFGHFAPQLGDGRALLVGEVLDRAGCRRDIQLKGSGRTVFSRGGDGRAAVGPVLREYLISEAMHALGVPTTRSLAAVATGEYVFREEALPGAVLTRVAASHIRVGTFQFFAARGDLDAVRTLADYALARHYPALANTPSPALALLESVIAAQVRLIAQWMGLGFIHGVMNTDNMTVSGETIDYGPCAFMDAYDPARVFSSIDRQGRYAFGNQPRIAQWNLARLAETLLPLIDRDGDAALAKATSAVDAFPALFQREMTGVLRAKLGLAREEEGDLALAQDLLEIIAANGADYTLTFRSLAKAIEAGTLARLFNATDGIDGWLMRWRARLARENASSLDIAARLDTANPAVIPRNHLVEDALAAATKEGDLAPFEALLAAVTRPFEPPSGASGFDRPPVAANPGYRTFCGT